MCACVCAQCLPHISPTVVLATGLTIVDFQDVERKKKRVCVHMHVCLHCACACVRGVCVCVSICGVTLHAKLFGADVPLRGHFKKIMPAVAMWKSGKA